MDAITRQLTRGRRQKEKASQREEREATKQIEAKVDQRFALALARVQAAAEEAIERTTADSLDWWIRYGHTTKVCRVHGPHDSFLCWMHRKTVTLIWLPTHAPLYLGSDGHIYRQGATKYYRAELNKRRRPGQIRRVAKILDRLNTSQPPIPDKYVNDEYY